VDELRGSTKRSTAEDVEAALPLAEWLLNYTKRMISEKLRERSVKRIGMRIEQRKRRESVCSHTLAIQPNLAEPLAKLDRPRSDADHAFRCKAR